MEKMSRSIEPPEGVSYRSKRLPSLLLLITFTFNYSTGVQSKKHGTNASTSSFKSRKQIEGLLWSVNHVRKRRETNTAELLISVSTRWFFRIEGVVVTTIALALRFSQIAVLTTKNIAVHRNWPKRKLPSGNVSIGDGTRVAPSKGHAGVWMAYKCPTDWSVEESRYRCENAPPQFSLQFSYPIEDHIPVIGTNGYTFCALCNGIENYTAWNLGVSSPVSPPDGRGFGLEFKAEVHREKWREG